MFLLKRNAVVLGVWMQLASLFGAPPAAAQNTALPAAAYFQNPVFSGAVLSPDGTLLAMRVGAADSRDRLAVLDLATQKVQPVASFSDADVNQFRWVNTSRLVFNLADKRGLLEDRHSAPGLYAVNADGSGFRQLVQREKAWSRDKSGTSQLMERERVYVPDNTGTNQPVERERVTGRDGIASTQLPFGTRLFEQAGAQDSPFVHVLMPDGPDEQQPVFFKLARLNTISGRVEDVEAPLNAVQWLLDGQGVLVAVLSAKDKGAGQNTLALQTRQAGATTWRQARTFERGAQNSLTLRAVAPDGKLYVTARPGRDTEAVYSLDPATGQLADKPLMGTALYDITPEFISSNKALLGLRFTVDAEVTQWFDAGLQAAQIEIDKLLPNTANMLSPPRTGASPWLLVRSFADVQPAVHQVFNSQNKKLTRLGAEQPTIQAAAMSAMDLVRLKTRDGAELPAYLTLPAAVALKKNLPLVVWAPETNSPRGPAWQWQAGVQFLASRGYAVLQPQTRGGAGFGQLHAAAGFKQTDLADAASWAVAQGIADPKRVCVLGSAGGGAAALAALAQDGAIFRCGVAWALSEEPGVASLTQSAPRIQNPLLLGHGRLDRVTPASQAQKLADAVKTHNPQVLLTIYPEEGHGWALPSTQVDWWTQVETFLARHLAKAGS